MVCRPGEDMRLSYRKDLSCGIDAILLATGAHAKGHADDEKIDTQSLVNTPKTSLK